MSQLYYLKCLMNDSRSVIYLQLQAPAQARRIACMAELVITARVIAPVITQDHAVAQVRDRYVKENCHI